MSNDLIVRPILLLPAREQLELRQIWKHSVATDTNAIGWLPTAAFDTRAADGDLTVIHRNGDLVGWAMHCRSRSRGVMKLYQIWVRPDARVLEHGRALIAQIKATCTTVHCWCIEAWVAEDLPANFFWEAIGFTKTNWRWGKGEKKRRHIKWLVLTPDLCDNTKGEKAKKAEKAK